MPESLDVKVKEAKVDIVPIPIQVLVCYQHVTLVADVVRVNGIRLFVSMLRHMNFITTQHISNATNNTLHKCTVAINNVYKKQGFIIKMLHFDSEFLSLENNLAGNQITLNTTSEDEYVGNVKHLICTINEWMRGIYNTLPFTKYPGRLIIELCYASMFWFNYFHPCQSPINGMNP